MIRIALAIIALAVSPAFAADVIVEPQTGAGMWVTERGSDDSLRGMWLVNTGTGQVFRCSFAGSGALCIQARMLTADEAAKAAKTKGRDLLEK